MSESWSELTIYHKGARLRESINIEEVKANNIIAITTKNFHVSPERKIAFIKSIKNRKVSYSRRYCSKLIQVSRVTIEYAEISQP